jgi:hypothetical protein
MVFGNMMVLGQNKHHQQDKMLISLVFGMALYLKHLQQVKD